MSKFKVGDKVVLRSGVTWSGQAKYRLVKHVIDDCCYKLSWGEHWNEESDLVWVETELELYKELEFTFQEVIARIKPGEKYVQSNCSSCDFIEMERNGGIKIKFNQLILGLYVEDARFKLEDKKEYTVYEVEFKKGGPLCFKYVSNQELELYTFVNVGDSNKYARVIGKETVEMTEEEYKQMKECWEA